MRIIASLILSIVIFCNSALASQDFDKHLNFGMEQYKKGNVNACLAVMKKLIKQNPANSYVSYYMAISYAKLGKLSEAQKAYENVIMLNQNKTLVSYSKSGLSEVEAVLSKKDNKISDDKKIAKPVKLVSKKNIAKKSKLQANDTPSDAEIANAIKVLKKAGLLNVNVGLNNKNPVQNPANNMNMPYNNDLMQMNMLFGNMGSKKNKGGMDMMPFLMMQAQNQDGTKKNITPEIMQVMMNNMMLDGMSSFGAKDN